jgi:hypothetical protein
MPPELEEWLARRHEVAPPGWQEDLAIEQLRCPPDLVARLSELVGPQRPHRVFVGGCPVIHHPSGPAYAAAYGMHDLLVRERGGWNLVDPWMPDVTFLKGTDQLRARLQRAYDAFA